MQLNRYNEKSVTFEEAENKIRKLTNFKNKFEELRGTSK